MQSVYFFITAAVNNGNVAKITQRLCQRNKG